MYLFLRIIFLFSYFICFLYVLFTVDPEVNEIILLMRKMQVSVICINNITYLFFTWFEQYFYLLGNTFKQPVQQPLRPSHLVLFKPNKQKLNC